MEDLIPQSTGLGHGHRFLGWAWYTASIAYSSPPASFSINNEVTALHCLKGCVRIHTLKDRETPDTIMTYEKWEWKCGQTEWLAHNKMLHLVAELEKSRGEAQSKALATVQSKQRQCTSSDPLCMLLWDGTNQHLPSLTVICCHNSCCV